MLNHVQICFITLYYTSLKYSIFNYFGRGRHILRCSWGQVRKAHWRLKWEGREARPQQSRGQIPKGWVMSSRLDLGVLRYLAKQDCWVCL